MKVRKIMMIPLCMLACIAWVPLLANAQTREAAQEETDVLVLRYGEHAIFDGTVAEVGDTATLEFAPMQGSFSPVKKIVSTDKTYHFDVVPKEPGYYRVRASGQILTPTRVRISLAVTLSIRQPALPDTASEPVGKTVFTGRVKPLHDNFDKARAILQKRVSGKWKEIKRTSLVPRKTFGTYRLTYRVMHAARFRVKVKAGSIYETTITEATRLPHVTQ